jgi:light-regulated signal transduction histidine kinase (bacteriophytochrome)
VEVVIERGLVAHGDPALLRLLLENLLGNAWKYTSKHAEARITVGAERDTAPTVYFVRDDGAGFDMAHAGHLFEPFHRLHGPGEFDGTGIGLATVARIVRRHHGRVWAEGGVEHGATIRFTLAQG